MKWRKRWLKSEKGRNIAKYHRYPTREAPKIYKDRTKAFSSSLIALRTEKIGLQAFLSKVRVPGYESPICQNCQQEEETVQHFLYKCPIWESYRDILGLYREKSLRDTLDSREGSKKAVEFLWATKRLD